MQRMAILASQDFSEDSVVTEPRFHTFQKPGIIRRNKQSP
jgi:hypothetical protein